MIIISIEKGTVSVYDNETFVPEPLKALEKLLKKEKDTEGQLLLQEVMRRIKKA